MTGESRLSDSVRVLIADDHPLVLGALREAISGAIPGARISEATDFESLAAALEETPDMDLVLLDLTMPGVPVMVVSGNEDRAVMRHCIDFGAAAYVPKSLDVATMRAAIRKVLEGGQWTPPDLDLSAQPNGEASALVRRLS